MKSLYEIQSEIIEAEKDMEETKNRHKKEIIVRQSHINDLKSLKAIHVAGVSVAQVEIAESVLRVKGILSGAQRAKAVDEAIGYIATSDTPMKKEFVGVKHYSGFSDQSCNCSYGCGPRHGSIVFAIESIKRKDAWTGKERDAAIYYLSNLEKIQAAKTEAAS